jgi:hypothetical protein
MEDRKSLLRGQPRRQEPRTRVDRLGGRRATSSLFCTTKGMLRYLSLALGVLFASSVSAGGYLRGYAQGVVHEAFTEEL